MLELNSCRLRMQAQPIIFCNQEQLKLKILTENWKRKLKLVRQCYFFLVQPSFSLQQCWQQKKMFYLRFQTHQQCLLSLRLWCLSEQKKNLKDFFLGKDIYMVCVSSNQLYQSTSPLIFHAVPTNTSAMLLTFVGFVFDATGNIR